MKRLSPTLGEFPAVPVPPGREPAEAHLPAPGIADRLKPHLLRAGSFAINCSGANELVGRRHRGLGGAFLLHSVAEDPRRYLNNHLHASRRLIDEALAHYRRSGVDIVTLDEAMRRLAEGGRRFVCFTFDDGYRDNLTTALPIFERYAAPFTVFVTTSFINRSFDFWWGALIEAIRANDTFRVEDGDRVFSFDTRGFDAKVRAYTALTTAECRGLIPRQAIAAAVAGCGIEVAKVLDAIALDERELSTLAQSPLVEIGAHTHSHPKLSDLDEDGVRSELATNKAYLQNLLGREVRHFSYPFGGHCGEREFRIAREVGFRTGWTGEYGALFPQHTANLTNLPRLRAFTPCDSLDVMECSRLGSLPALARRFRAPLAAR